MARNVPLLIGLLLLLVAVFHDEFVAKTDPEVRVRQGKALSGAIFDNDIEKVRRLLKSGVDPNQIMFDGLLPLVLAMKENHAEIFDVLLDAGAEVNKVYHFMKDGSVYGWQPIHFAAERSDILGPEDSWAFMEKLLARGADVNALTDSEERTPLHFAAWRGSAYLVDRLLAAGADPNRWDDVGFSVLFYAAVSGDMNVFKRLLAAGADPHAVGSNGQLLLHAVSGDSGEIVRYLLDAGLDPNARDPNQSTPLHDHAKANDTDSMRLLLQAGADPHAVDGDGDQPLHKVPERFGQSAEAIQLLLEAGVAVDVRNAQDGATALHRAAREDDGAAVQALLAHGADVNAVDHKGWTVFHYAISDHSRIRLYDAIPILVSHKADINRLDHEELETPLYMAIREKNHAGAEVLLRAGADPMARVIDGQTALHRLNNDGWWLMSEMVARKAQVDAQDMHGDTPLHDALGRYAPEIVQGLLALGADVNHPDDMGATPLHAAARTFALHPLKLLMPSQPAVNARDNLGNTPLHIAVYGQRPDLISFLRRNGADMNIANNQGITPLQLAQSTPPLLSALNNPLPDPETDDDGQEEWAKNLYNYVYYLSHDAQRMRQAIRDNDIKGVRTLLERGVSPNVGYREGKTVLNLALDFQRRDIVTLLLEHGAKTGLEGGTRSPLPMAIDWNDTGVIEELLEYGADINARDPFCNLTPLQFAIALGKFESFLFLLEKGARIDGPCCGNRSLLHAAAWSDKTTPKFFEKLLDLGVLVNGRDFSGKSPLDVASRMGTLETVTYLLDRGGEVVPPPGIASPLHHAARGGHPDVVSLLVARGADVNAQDGGGLTPLHWAIYSKSPDTVRRLLDLGADNKIQDKALRTPLGMARAFGHGALDTAQVLAQVGAP